MRSVLGDIINHDPRFHVEDKARDGLEALELLRKKQYDAVVLDVNMPRMSGIELLKTLQKERISAHVMVASTDTTDGSRTALDALELGAVDVMHKPDRASECRGEDFTAMFLETLAAVCGSTHVDAASSRMDAMMNVRRMTEGLSGRTHPTVTGSRVVAIASSTGGPRALQSVIPRLPKNLNAPVVLVQHMPVGFTATLAERLNSMSELTVREAKEGDFLEPGVVYIAKGGRHMEIRRNNGRHYIHMLDTPPRENVKPCANYMFESLADADFDTVVCVVLTGMGEDGLEGIRNLKKKKRVYVISQNADTCIGYGMPRAVEQAGLSNEVLPLNDIAGEIVTNTGVR